MEEASRPATREELAAWRRDLSAWASPPRFAALVESLSDAHGDYAIDQPGSVFREAFVASRCAAEFAADLVRLGADPPDFELVIGQAVELYEVVEVQAPGRRRGDELGADRLKEPEERARLVHVPDEEWCLAADALRQIADAANNKAAKRYLPGTILVAYLNFGFVRGNARLRAGLVTAFAPALIAFKEVWVLDNGRLSRVEARH